MKYPLLFLFCGFCSVAQAQMERTIYQIFPVDSIKTVALDVADVYDIFSWSGDNILVETNIKISFASPEILEYLVQEGRYDLVMDTLAPDATKIYTRIRDRKPVKTPAGECTEIPEAKIFVPDTFIWTDDKKTLTRKE